LFARCTPLLVGAASWFFSATASAATVVYGNDFDHCGSVLAQCVPTSFPAAPVPDGSFKWDFAGVQAGAAALHHTNDATPAFQSDASRLHTTFLGEFGGDDTVELTVKLPANTASVNLSFDAYLLRTWDGINGDFSGPDNFGYGYIDGAGDKIQLLNASFSDGNGMNTFCGAQSSPCAARTGETTALPDASGNLLNVSNRLGYKVELQPPPGGTPPLNTELSLVYGFDTGSIAPTADTLTFYFFSTGLQVHPNLTDPTPFHNIDVTRPQVLDESWGLDNLSVTVTTAVPEPRTWAFVLTALLLFGAQAWRRRKD